MKVLEIAYFVLHSSVRTTPTLGVISCATSIENVNSRTCGSTKTGLSVTHHSWDVFIHSATHRWCLWASVKPPGSWYRKFSQCWSGNEPQSMSCWVLEFERTRPGIWIVLEFDVLRRYGHMRTLRCLMTCFHSFSVNWLNHDDDLMVVSFILNVTWLYMTPATALDAHLTYGCMWKVYLSVRFTCRRRSCMKCDVLGRPALISHISSSALRAHKYFSSAAISQTHSFWRATWRHCAP